jgi:phosphopantetheinyl transferase (holo-ACP synthase)
MLGNDIIDLQITHRTTNWERPRWLQKVFTPKEQAVVRASTNPFTTVWRLWSIKESAYKVYLQAGGTPFLAATNIECCLETAKHSTAEIAGLRLCATTLETPTYIFSTAQRGNTAIQNSLFTLEKSNLQQQSVYLKQQLLQAVAATHCLALSALQLRKTATGVPQLFYENQLLPLALSITHHGQYGGYSILEKK